MPCIGIHNVQDQPLLFQYELATFPGAFGHQVLDENVQVFVAIWAAAKIDAASLLCKSELCAWNACAFQAKGFVLRAYCVWNLQPHHPRWTGSECQVLQPLHTRRSGSGSRSGHASHHQSFVSRPLVLGQSSHARDGAAAESGQSWDEVVLYVRCFYSHPFPNGSCNEFWHSLWQNFWPFYDISSAISVGVVSAISFCLTYLLTAFLTYLVTLFLTCLLTPFLGLWQAQYLVKFEGYAFGSAQCKWPSAEIRKVLVVLLQAVKSTIVNGP